MTDWLMVIITAIYVVATIFICIYNGRSAKATQDQLKESRQQYEETKRLEMMPYIQFDRVNQHSSDIELNLVLCDNEINGPNFITIFQVKNIGNGTARNITYYWNNFTNRYNRGDFPINALQCSDSKIININFILPNQEIENTVASFDIYFADLLENQYVQKIEFIFKKTSNQLFFDKIKSYSPELVRLKEDNNV